MSLTYKDHLQARLLPPVKKIELISKDIFEIKDNCLFEICSNGNCKKNVIDFAKMAWNISPKVNIVKIDKTSGDESYEISIEKTKISINAAADGVLNALKTIRQLAESKRGVLKSTTFIVPIVKISDSPDLAFRGIHLCWFPETKTWEIEKQVRMAAYYKFNYAVIESWGILKYSSHPEFCWEEYAIEPEEFKRLVKLAKTLGLTLIPQVNIFGHATCARCGTGKHVMLDFHPEYASLFEPDGWTWCLSNSATRQFLTDIILEVYEIFDCPPYMHLGCDEAYNHGSCYLCANIDYKQALLDHILYFYAIMAEQNAKIMIWHDMLLDRADSRWDNYIVYGKSDLAKLYRDLPRDIIICDWQYGYPEEQLGHKPNWPTMKFFKNEGFQVLGCPWRLAAGIEAIGKFTVQEKFLGMLATTWNLNNNSMNCFNEFAITAKASWNAEYICSTEVVQREYMNLHFRQISHDMKISSYIMTGTTQYQINPHNYQA
jgi:hypothetical protein